MNQSSRPETEVRITSSTGGQKGQKMARLGALDPKSLRIVAEVAGFGAEKYAAFNFLKGYDWSLSYDALQRHLMSFWDGEDLDQESGLPHLAHAAWHCLALLSFDQRELGTDDRPDAVLDLRDEVIDRNAFGDNLDEQDESFQRVIFDQWVSKPTDEDHSKPFYFGAQYPLPLGAISGNRIAEGTITGPSLFETTFPGRIAPPKRKRWFRWFPGL